MSHLRAAVALAALAACSDDGNNKTPDAVSASCMEATSHSDLPWIQEHVFTPSCASFTSCHMGAAVDAGGLSLEEGQSRMQMVNVDSMVFPQFKRVVPGDPDNSYLIVILGLDRNMDGKPDGPIKSDVGTMPYNNPLLCKEKRDAIERWVAAGAHETEETDAGTDAPADAPTDAPPDA